MGTGLILLLLGRSRPRPVQQALIDLIPSSLSVPSRECHAMETPLLFHTILHGEYPHREKASRDE
jgi:hypothetical protein